MIVSSNFDTAECTTFSEYQTQITKCLERPSGNEIWCNCSDGIENYPCLSILVKGETAVVNYFSEGNTEMYVSLGDPSKSGIVDFEDGQYAIAAYQIISSTKALECALQFYYNQEKPYCIEWDEL
ncbi:hypothetical protein IGI37_003066 [Enterococcus sp. AZ194]|uniref:hypothetical protein n=1 Tax=Enterococcus sp. AZ194 TaxID=2774629 RepID=UPI003F214586